MSSHIERQARRLIALKQAQQQLARNAANAQLQAADASHQRAVQLREVADQALQAARPQPEQGLTRSGLFDRLRLLAVARAHGLESELAAKELDKQAGDSEAEAHTLQQRAVEHQRKQQKLDQWRQRRSQQAARQRDARHYLQQLEDYLCCRHPQR